MGVVSDGTTVIDNGTVNGTITWQSVQTTGFTAVAGKGYPCNTTSAGFTVTLPATPSAGDQVQIVDYAGTFDTNNLTINPNGEDIEGGTNNLLLTGEREGVTLTYIDATQGWIATSGINEGTDALEPDSYSVDFLVVAGGGGSNINGAAGGYNGGGGAGGFRTSTQTINGGTVVTVTVGDGGSGADGSASSISGSGLTTISSAGGGRGAQYTSGQNGYAGGSGGGSSYQGTGGSGNTPSTSPSQGNNGGSAFDISPYYCGGGGGAGQAGQDGTNPGGNGGNGTASSITGSSVTYAGGGGSSVNANLGASNTVGGTGGGGNGSQTNTAQNGTANTGGGAGGAQTQAATSGGKGVVILSVPTAKYSSTTTGSPVVTTSGSNTIMQFNGSGSYTA